MSGLQWVRMDSQWPNNPKFLQLAADKKWRAITVYWAGLGWSGAQGQAGFLPAYALPTVYGTRREATELCDVGLWHPISGGWNINDWIEYQPTNEETEARSKRARDAALVRWQKVNGVKL